MLPQALAVHFASFDRTDRKLWPYTSQVLTVRKFAKHQINKGLPAPRLFILYKTFRQQQPTSQLREQGSQTQNFVVLLLPTPHIWDNIRNKTNQICSRALHQKPFLLGERIHQPKPAGESWTQSTHSAQMSSSPNSPFISYPKKDTTQIRLINRSQPGAQIDTYWKVFPNEEFWLPTAARV